MKVNGRQLHTKTFDTWRQATLWLTATIEDNPYRDAKVVADGPNSVTVLWF